MAGSPDDGSVKRADPPTGTWDAWPIRVPDGAVDATGRWSSRPAVDPAGAVDDGEAVDGVVVADEPGRAAGEVAVGLGGLDPADGPAQPGVETGEGQADDPDAGSGEQSAAVFVRQGRRPARTRRGFRSSAGRVSRPPAPAIRGV